MVINKNIIVKVEEKRSQIIVYIITIKLKRYVINGLISYDVILRKKEIIISRVKDKFI